MKLDFSEQKEKTVKFDYMRNSNGNAIKEGFLKREKWTCNYKEVKFFSFKNKNS